jgi:hypothetical protein
VPATSIAEFAATFLFLALHDGADGDGREQVPLLVRHHGIHIHRLLRHRTPNATRGTPTSLCWPRWLCPSASPCFWCTSPPSRSPAPGSIDQPRQEPRRHHHLRTTARCPHGWHSHVSLHIQSSTVGIFMVPIWTNQNYYLLTMTIIAIAMLAYWMVVTVDLMGGAVRRSGACGGVTVPGRHQGHHPLLQVQRSRTTRTCTLLLAGIHTRILLPHRPINVPSLRLYSVR